MNFLTKISRTTLTNFFRASFASDNFKDRDKSAEKVYISQEESTLSLKQKKLSRNCWTRLSNLRPMHRKTNSLFSASWRTSWKNMELPVQHLRLKSTIFINNCDWFVSRNHMNNQYASIHRGKCFWKSSWLNILSILYYARFYNSCS